MTSSYQTFKCFVYFIKTNHPNSQYTIDLYTYTDRNISRWHKNRNSPYQNFTIKNYIMPRFYLTRLFTNLFNKNFHNGCAAPPASVLFNSMETRLLRILPLQHSYTLICLLIDLWEFSNTFHNTYLLGYFPFKRKIRKTANLQAYFHVFMMILITFRHRFERKHHNDLNWWHKLPVSFQLRTISAQIHVHA